VEFENGKQFYFPLSSFYHKIEVQGVQYELRLIIHVPYLGEQSLQHLFDRRESRCMEIERINENTVKFYISYIDIEERGFNREEIWYDRERSEELFWEMMDEIHHEEEFIPDGPLWIQVQALEKGLEVLVTKAQLSKDGQRFELPIPEDKLKNIPLTEPFAEFFADHFEESDSQEGEDASQIYEMVMVFKEFEDLISLAKVDQFENVLTKLFNFENRYYLYVEFPAHEFEEEDIDDILSRMLEFGEESPVTIHRLEEYGKIIMKENVFSTINTFFNQQ